VRHFALSAIGRDRPGIVASVTGVLVDHGVNIEDSQATILRGHFTMMLIVALPDSGDPEHVLADLRGMAAELELEALAFQPVAEVDPAGPEPSHTVTVYGADHPGIVHSAAQALAERAIDITDLNTRLVQEEGAALYVLMMEVALPEETPVDELRSALDDVGRREGVEVSLHELEQDAL
jgi:glycine cleavage system transcriptional repressor